METKQDPKPTKSKAAQSTSTSVRVRRETKRRLFTELAKVNKKTFGKKVHLDAVISRALDRLTDHDIVDLQETSLSNADRLEIAYRDHIKAHGATTKDDFIGIMLASTRVDKSTSGGDAESRENSVK